MNDLVKPHGGPAIQTEGVHTEALRALIPEIVQQVVRTLQPAPTSSNIKTKNKKSTNEDQEICDDSETELETEEGDSSSSSAESLLKVEKSYGRGLKRKKKAGKKFNVNSTTALLPQLALCYPVPKSVQKEVKEGKFIPLYKLLPGLLSL